MSSVPKMLFDPLGPVHLKWSYLPRLLPWLIPFLRRANRRDMEATAAALATLLGDATDQHLALATGTPAERYVTLGNYVMLYPDRAKFAGDALGHGLRQAHGARLEEWDRERLKAEDPHLGPYYQFAAVYPGNGWITNPGAYVAALFAAYRSGGGQFRQGEVDDIRPAGGGAEVAVGGETLAFDRAVLAGGVWSDRLARRLGHRTAMESERGYHLVFRNPSRVPPTPYSLSDAKVIATPMEGGIRVAGQVEFGGLDAPMSEAPFRVARERIRRVYPDLEWDGEDRWMGHRPSTVDSLPLIGPSPKAPAIQFAFGAQHIGLTSGPRTGRLIADLIAGRTPNIDMKPFRVGRFDRPSVN
jgi:D-amino-acid dehydrogenase